ncbi:MAG: Transcriptional regulator, TetR family [Labilithrix sp.]|jgi:AcrR family transcriptional regulator|nr:Transcriptional regulator, TetR family [Labilithrix sp.]
MVMVKTTPRKKPRQARSKAMVESILEATIRVLVARGYEGTTTIAIAERAGVSVGSLYQYFPNKESLVAALVERHTAELVACTDRVLAAADVDNPRETIRALVRAGTDAHRIDPALHKILVEQVPRIGKIKTAMDTSKVIVAKLTAYLEEHRKSLAVTDPAVAAFVVETVVEALTHRVVIERPDLASASYLEEEAAALVLGYLFTPRTTPVRRKDRAKTKT